MNDFLLSYDTVVLRPNHSDLSSRSNGDTRINFCGTEFLLPVCPANMEDVISERNARTLSEMSCFYIYHRFGEESNEHPQIKPATFVRYANEQRWRTISISVGTNGKTDEMLKLLSSDGQRIDFITIDVAHGDHENMKPTIESIRKWYPNSKLIAGNVATAGGYLYLKSLGVDAVKVGIGGGSICTTRYKTGFHLPTLHSVYEINQVLDPNCPIIADGGAKHYGDVAKALTFGASMVMSGGWFASCIDSPAKIVEGRKMYRGSTSYESKGKHKHIEGRTVELDEGFTYEERMNEISEAIKSSISYAGGHDLSAFKEVEWKRILPFH